MPNPIMADYYTTAEAADLAGISQERVVQLINAGTLKAIKPGVQWFIPKEELAEGAPFWSRKAGRPRKDK